MTTTAFDDQFTPATQTIEPVRQPYSTEAILRRNIAALEVALKQQTERADAAEQELKAAREQEPVGWMRDDGNLYLSWQKDLCLPEVKFQPLYARPIPAPAAPAPSVPDEWKQAVTEFLSAHDAAWAELFKSLPAGTVSVTVSNQQADAVRTTNVLRALLQYAEVRHD